MMMRSAMSMLELVFAIVIMGIAVMSLPLILTQVQTNNAFAMQQEAILAAKTKLGDILTYEWDESSYAPTASYSFVLDTAHGDNALKAIAGTPRRVGHINTDYRRKFFPRETNATNIGADGGDLDDIDDFSGLPPIALTVTAGENARNLDYVFINLNLSATVNYVADTATYSNTPLNDFTFNPDNAPASPTNIKAISVTVTGADQNITLRAFSCNIGESPFLPSRPYL